MELPSLSHEQIEVVKAEIDRQRILADLVCVAVNNTKTTDDYSCLMTKAKYEYAIPEHGRIYNTVIGLWALLWLAIYDWVDYFQAINMEG